MYNLQVKYLPENSAREMRSTTLNGSFRYTKNCVTTAILAWLFDAKELIEDSNNTTKNAA
tara:strand:+ start:3305 stop:3484 length:180 start_codon:yes stop_codon:yes gene_type:complete